jgi:hypothetical protein
MTQSLNRHVEKIGAGENNYGPQIVCFAGEENKVVVDRP